MNNTIVQQSMTIESAIANAPTWATKIDADEIRDPESRPFPRDAFVYNYGENSDGAAHLMRTDAYDEEGVDLGEVEVRVWLGGNSIDVAVSDATPDELRRLAVDLQKVARQIDEIQAVVK